MNSWKSYWYLTKSAVFLPARLMRMDAFAFITFLIMSVAATKFFLPLGLAAILPGLGIAYMGMLGLILFIITLSNLKP